MNSFSKYTCVVHLKCKKGITIKDKMCVDKGSEVYNRSMKLCL